MKNEFSFSFNENKFLCLMKTHNICNFSGIIPSKKTPHVLQGQIVYLIWYVWQIFMFDILTICCWRTVILSFNTVTHHRYLLMITDLCFSEGFEQLFETLFCNSLATYSP